MQNPPLLPSTPSSSPASGQTFNNAVISPTLPVQHRKDAPAFYKHATYAVRGQTTKQATTFGVDNPNGLVELYANHKGFEIEENLRLYSGEDMTSEVLRIGARNGRDASSIYDVTDATNEEKVGALRHKMGKSTARDEWEILDARDRLMGTVVEESLTLALVRGLVKFASPLLPRNYDVHVGGRDVGRYTRNQNSKLVRVACDFALDQNGVLDRRLGLAAAILMCAPQSKQR